MANTSKTSYKYMLTYAGTLASGQPVEPGQEVKLDKDEVEANAQMIEDGQLVDMTTTKEGGDK